MKPLNPKPKHSYRGLGFRAMINRDTTFGGFPKLGDPLNSRILTIRTQKKVPLIFGKSYLPIARAPMFGWCKLRDNRRDP